MERAWTASIAIAMIVAGCAEDRVVQPSDGADGGATSPDDADAAPSGPRPDGGAASAACDMSGDWIVAQVAFSTALGAEQTSVNWFYHRISQVGDQLVIDDSLNCGFRVTGTTTVTLADAALEALAQRNSSSVGRGGTMRETPSGDACEFELARTYNIRAANKETFLTDHWQLGDPPKDLDSFPTLPKTPEAGMEDWDGDGSHGFTLNTGIGQRFVSQRDWNEHRGTVPKDASEFGGDGVVVVTWDGQEGVSDQTTPLLRTTSEPKNPGYAYYKRVGDELEVVDSGPHPELETCKNVQRLALETWPQP